MKILLITARFPFGSKEPFLTEEIAQLSQWFDVLVIPATPTGDPLSVPWLNNRALRLRMGSPLVLKLALAETFSRPISALRAFASIVRAPRGLRARIANAAIFPKALAVSRIARRERVEHVHGYWLSTPSTIAYVVSRLCRIPWSATGHRHDLVDSNVRTVGSPSSGFIPTARFIRTISEQGAQQLQHLKQTGMPVHVIHLGVVLPSPQARKADGIFNLLCAANLERVKDHETLLSALALASQKFPVRATIAGDGTLRSALEARAAALGLGEAVTFEGVVPHARLLERIETGEFDAAILTSRDEGPSGREGIPVFLMEAMARGLPVVATSSGGVGELADATNAIVCPPGDTRAVADAIERLARDPSLRLILGNGGRRTIENAFDVEATSRRLAAEITPELKGSQGRSEAVSRDSAVRETSSATIIRRCAGQ